MKKGFGSPLLLSILSLLGTLLLASVYLYTEFILKNYEHSLEVDSQRAKEETTSHQKDQQIKITIASIIPGLQGYYATSGNGKYPVSLEELVKTGSLKEIPKTPPGGDYQYILCSSSTEAILFAQLYEDESYWVWKSYEGTTASTKIMPTQKTCEESGSPIPSQPTIDTRTSKETP